MFDDLDEDLSTGDYSPSKASSEKKPYTPGGFNKFPKKEIKQYPYLPISIFVDREYPNEVKDKIYSLIDTLISKNYTVRVTGDDKDFYAKIKPLMCDKLEVYIPWKMFNDIESKFYFSHEEIKTMAQAHFPAWDKVPDVIKAMIARNFRMIVGTDNNSCTNIIVLWSQDGASKVTEVTKDSGRFSYIIKAAGKFGIPIVNMAKANQVQNLINHVTAT